MCKRSYRGYLKSNGYVAFFLMLLGAFLLGFNLGWIPMAYKQIVFSWPMMLLVLGLFFFIRKRFIGGVFLFFMGFLFLLSLIQRNFPEFMGGITINIRDYWPLILILGGFLFLIRKRFGTRKKVGRGCRFFVKTDNINNGYTDHDFINKEVAFSSSEQIMFSSNFKGGKLKVVFGEFQLDLRKITTLDAFNSIDIMVTFGSLILYVPQDWQLNIKTEVLFGDIQDKRSFFGVSSDENIMTLNLEGQCVFGSIEIRN